MDVHDQATEAEELHRERALQAQMARAPAIPADWEAKSAKWCTDAQCGERIPDERRRAIPGVKFCVECQERRELQERRQRRTWS